jgi:plastocyanin
VKFCAAAFYLPMSEVMVMKKSVKTGRRAGSVFSLIALAMLVPEVILAGPGCMKNHPMAGGYYPHTAMGPHAGYYAQGVYHPYNTAPGAHESNTLRISGMRFEAARIAVKPGTTVIRIQEIPVPHGSTGSAGSLDSGPLYNGQICRHTHEKDGLFSDYCGIHPSMTGSVVVM